MLARLFAAALVAVLPCPAQRTWIVDQAGGAGFDFLDLPAALTAAQDSDTIVVRAGTYRGGSTSKELTLLGEPGARLGGLFPVPMSVTLFGLGRKFVMRGFEIDYSSNGVQPFGFDGRSTGRVFLEDMVVRSARGIPAIGGGSVELLSLSNCVLSGSPGLFLQNVNLTMTRCSATGLDAAGNVQAAYGIYLASSNGTLTQCTSRGGNGLPSSFQFAAAPGLYLQQSTVVVAGDANSSFSAGGLSAQESSAIAGQTSTLDIDPSVHLQPHLTALPVGPLGTIRTHRVPAVWTAQTPSQLDTVFYAPTGHSLVLFVSVPDLRYSLPPLGDLWIDPTQIILATGTVQGPGEHWQLGFPLLPTVPRGLAIGLQGLSGATINTMTLSTPSTVVLR